MKSLRSSVTIVIAIIVVSSMCLIGCNQSESNPSSSVVLPQYSYVGASNLNAPHYPELNNEGYYDWLDIEYLNYESEIISVLDRFSVDSFVQVALQNKDGNSCYSPVSLFYALSMAAYGAQGQTKDELFDALGIKDDSDMIEQYRSLYLMMYTQEMVDQKLANSIWMSNSDLGFNPEYIDLMQDKLFAEIYGVDFGTAEADVAMGEWVRDHTEGSVASTFKSDEQWAMALMNTVFFKGSWADEFDAGLTHDADFTCQDGSVVQTEFMVQESNKENNVTLTDEYDATSLYLTNGAQLRFVLPAEGVSVADIIAKPQVLREALYGEPTQQATVTFTVPRVDFTQSHDLVDTVKSLGVHDAFTTAADFSGMLETSTLISAIKQDIHFAIDEQGVMGAAYTAVEMMPMSAAPPETPENHIDFTLDKPFIYALVSPERATLFMGCINNPNVK